MVRKRLEELELPYVMLNQWNFDDIEVEFEVSANSLRGELRIAETCFALERFTGIYARLMDSEILPCVDEARCNVLRRQAVYDTLLAWLEISPARVINRSAPMGSNFSKPYQLQLIHAQGFSVPETLITNDPDLVREFLCEHKQVVYKSISSIRSIVRTLREEDSERLECILSCPTQFQAYVDGINVRFHVVGKTVYASAIATDATDYRYAHREGRRVEIYEIELPEELTERCVRLAEALELPFAGIDLKITAQNCAYCFEVNPSPGFSYYEQVTGQPIADTIARFLAGEQ